MYKRLIFSLGVFGILTILLAACAIVDTGGGPSGPTVHMGGSQFLQTSITIHKGDTLSIVDDVGSPHIITNGSWVGGSAKSGSESGAPTANLNFKGNDSGNLGPFSTAGTFHFYCTIHQGMNLAVTVQ